MVSHLVGLVVAGALVSACFHPSYDHVRCGPSGECPGGLLCNGDLVCDVPGGGGGDASSTDADLLGPACWMVSNARGFHVTACTMGIVANIDVSQSVSIDTDTGSSDSPDLRCAQLTSANNAICAVAAGAITIRAGVTLSAHGTRPLALLGHSVDLAGAIDVASHIAGPRGPGANLGCSPAFPMATGAGGGGGGGFGTGGGRGGSPGATGIGGGPGTSIALADLAGGCDGGRGGDGSNNGGPAGPGAAGGGAVWIASDTTPLTIHSTASIDASGASGLGGRSPGNSSVSHGGYGGGSGGLIVLQAPTIQLDATAVIFANGGHGGGGSEGPIPGMDGTDPTGPTGAGAGGGGGMGGAAQSLVGGDGGAGWPGSGSGPSGVGDGGMGEAFTDSGGGGGGGGAGVIAVASATSISGPNVSPPVVGL